MRTLDMIKDMVERGPAQDVFRVLKSSDDQIIFDLKSGGAGTMHMMQPFVGMLIAHHNVNTKGFALATHDIGEGLKLNYCIEGRLEIHMKESRVLYMAPGDISVETSTAWSFNFPCGFYRGVELFITEEFFSHQPLFFTEAGILMPQVMSSLCPDRMRNWIRRASENASFLLSELAKEPSISWPSKARLLIAQLLLCLAEEGAPMRETETPLFTKKQVEIAEKACELFCSDLSKRHSIDEVAREFQVSATSLKNYFQGVYGSSISAYLKQRRIEAAKELLKTSDAKVSRVAASVGYANPGKFSQAFKEHTGSTPLSWRKKNAR